MEMEKDDAVIDALNTIMDALGIDEFERKVEEEIKQVGMKGNLPPEGGKADSGVAVISIEKVE